MHDFFRLLHVFLKPVYDEWIASKEQAEQLFGQICWKTACTSTCLCPCQNCPELDVKPYLLVILEPEGLCATENVLSLHARLWIVR